MEGPFRGADSGDRRVVSRSEPAPRQQSAPLPPPQPITEEPPKTHRRSSAHHDHSNTNDKPRKKWLTMAITAIGIVLLIAIAWFAISNAKNGNTAIDGSKYQAVLLTNGESYFGKLSPLNDGFMKLTDIFYLKAKEPVTAEGEDTTVTAESDFQLIKFGGEVQGPEDEMIISIEQILYYENLKPDGKASKAIEQYKSTNK